MWAGQTIAGQTFPTTQWSLVLSAGHGVSPAQQRQALAALLRLYMPALRASLRSRRIAEDCADDLLQGFVADSVIQGGLIARADRGRGHFRALLLTALRNYVAKQARRDRALVRSPGRLKLIRWEDSAATVPAATGSADGFDVAWARETLSEALRRMSDECYAIARPDVWGVFRGRLLDPATDGSHPVPYEVLMSQHSFKSVKQAFNVLVTAKRTFDRTLRSVISEYAQSDEEIEDEIRSLKEILSNAGQCQR